MGIYLWHYEKEKINSNRSQNNQGVDDDETLHRLWGINARTKAVVLF